MAGFKSWGLIPASTEGDPTLAVLSSATYKGSESNINLLTGLIRGYIIAPGSELPSNPVWMPCNIFWYVHSWL